MRDTAQALRISVFNCLNGQLPNSVPVYDEKKKVGVTDSVYVLLSTQTETPIQENDCTWINESTIVISIYQRSGSEVSKDTIDTLSNFILVLMMPTPQTSNIIPPVGLQFCNHSIRQIVSRNLSITETESILEKSITFTVQIIQQN